MGGRASFGTSSKLKARTLSSAHFCLRNQSTELSTDRDFPHFHSHSQRERSKEKATTTTTIDIYYLLGATRIIQGARLECGRLLPPSFGEACFASDSGEIRPEAGPDRFRAREALPRPGNERCRVRSIRPNSWTESKFCFGWRIAFRKIRSSPPEFGGRDVDREPAWLIPKPWLGSRVYMTVI